MFIVYLDKFFIVFINDILIYSKNVEEYEEHLQAVLQKLRKKQLYVKFKKYKFWLKKIFYLGHVVSKDGIQVNPNKVVVIQDCNRPTNVGEVWSFFGLAGYYRRSVEEFSKIVVSMT